MEETNYFMQGVFFFLLALFTHWVGYKKELFSSIKTSYQSELYPFWGGILTLLTILLYLLPSTYIPWYPPLIALLVYFALGPRDQFKSLLKDRMTLPKTSLLRDALMGLSLFIVSLPFLWFLQTSLEGILTSYFDYEIPKQFVIEFLRQIKENKVWMVFYFFLICILIPTYEEFLYRANIQTWLKNRLPPFWAIFLTSVFFGFSHFFTIDTIAGKIIVITTTFVASMYLGFIYERQRSIIASITYHSLMNALNFVLILLGG